jgi:protein-tyrosine phosphatase
VLRQAVHALRQGQVVAFPTETGYVQAASALHSGAVERVAAPNDAGELSLMLRGAAEASSWVPGLSPLAQRLTRRCWPGPVALRLGTEGEPGCDRWLPEPVRRLARVEGKLSFRIPAHRALFEAALNSPAPLIIRDISGSEMPTATTAEEALQLAGGWTDLLVDDGRSRFDWPPTVIAVEGHAWSLVQEGVVSAEDLQRLTPTIVLFVCTGNTCRSPLAEALCKKLLAERLGCAVEELPQRGFVVLSAGLAAMMGGEAAAEAVEVARELGADLTGHTSRQLNARLVSQADFVLAMTRGHVLAVAQQFPRLGPPPRLLATTGEDLADPVGGDLPVYRHCAQQILRHLEGLLAELQPS